MSKKIKEMELSALRRSIGGVKDFVILEPIKVDSATDYEFRKKLRDKKCKVQLVKNSLARKIFEEGGLKVDAWSGPTLLVWGADSVKELGNAVDSTLKEVKKDPKAPDKFKEKIAVADGVVVTLKATLTMPTRKEAIGGVLDAILGPGASIAAALTGPATQLAGILKAIEEKAPAAGAAEAPTAAG